MVNEERSLAFWLLEQGYDVYCSNIRTNIRMPHRTVRTFMLIVYEFAKPADAAPDVFNSATYSGRVPTRATGPGACVALLPCRRLSTTDTSDARYR